MWKIHGLHMPADGLAVAVGWIYRFTPGDQGLGQGLRRRRHGLTNSSPGQTVQCVHRPSGREARVPLRVHAEFLEDLYRRYNRPEYVHPDPLEFVRRYRERRDREVVGLIASSLAYGRVAQILRSVQAVLSVLGDRPAQALRRTSPVAIRRMYAGFKHRFCTGGHLAALLCGARRALAEYGSLEDCFLAGVSGQDRTVQPALNAFVRRLTSGGQDCGHLLPDPSKASACKRLHLLLRWLVREDAVDLGVWRGVSPAMLIVPLDAHMHRLMGLLGATARQAADLKTAMEITDAFRIIAPKDPVKYDFALTRLGIHPGVRAEGVLRQYQQLE